jgi:tetratricopeptide (TPR) repeat protein
VSDAARYAKEADRALHEHDYDLAILGYNKVLQMEPSSAAAWSNLGTAWFAKGNFSQASDSFLRAARLQPANRDYAFNAGLVLVREDKCNVAERYLKKSLLSVQHRAAALYLIGFCAFVSENWTEAKDALLNAEAGGSRTAETYYMLTIAARKSRDPNQAKRAFGLLWSNFPTSSLLHELLGEAADEDFMSTEAEKELSLAISGSPQAPGLHAKLAFILWKRHRLPDAEKLFEQELVIDPHSYSAMHYLGDIAEQDNQLSQALMWYQRALREQPESGEAHFAAGRVLELMGQSQDALRELQASFPALESDASAHYWKARVLKKLGMKEQAQLELSKVQEINKAERNALIIKLNNGEQ